MLYYQSAGSLLSAAIALMVVDITAVSLRFYTRRRQRQALLTDDWLTVPALVLSVAVGICILIGHALDGLGAPAPLLNPDGTPRKDIQAAGRRTQIASQIEWASHLISILGLGLTKLSVLFFYRRIFVPTKAMLFSTVTYVMIWLVIAWTVSFFVAFVFTCGSDVTAWWRSFDAFAGECGRAWSMLYAVSASGFVMDALIVLLPLPTIWNLQLPFHQKLGVSALFFLGTMTAIVSMARMIVISRVYYIGYTMKEDTVLLISGIIYWTQLEVGLGLLAACLPTLRPLLRSIPTLSSFKSSSHSSSSTSATKVAASNPSSFKHRFFSSISSASTTKNSSDAYNLSSTNNNNNNDKTFATTTTTTTRSADSTSSSSKADYHGPATLSISSPLSLNSSTFPATVGASAPAPAPPPKTKNETHVRYYYKGEGGTYQEAPPRPAPAAASRTRTRRDDSDVWRDDHPAFGGGVDSLYEDVEALPMARY